MPLESIFTIVVLIIMMVLLVKEIASTDALLFGTLCVFLLSGIISPEDALSGFSNPGLLMIAVLFIVSAAIQNTGALNSLMYSVLQPTGSRKLSSLLLKMMIPVSFLSAFVSNTPLVMIFIPMIRKWSEKIDISPSKFFIPLSYAAILGGMCTLIGTSTNLVVHGLLIENGLPGLKMFELGKIGIPCMILGWLYLSFVGSKLLPNRKNVSDFIAEHKKEYVVEMRVSQGCELINKSIQQAGLRNLRGLYLVDIERGGESLGPISSKQVIQAEDRLMFAGVTSAVVDLQEIKGLVPATDDNFEKDFALIRTHLTEAVISTNSPIVDKTIKEANFRSKYHAAVVAVHRNGAKIESKIGSIQLRAGDTLLLLASDKFLDDWKDSQDFFLVSSIKSNPPQAQNKGYLALGILLMMVLSATFLRGVLLPGGEPVQVIHCVFGAALLMVLTRCVPLFEARKSIAWNVLITIGCAFGIGKALQNSGAAEWIANVIISFTASYGPTGTLIGVYVLTAIFTEVLTNNAAAAFVLPIALSAANHLGVSPMPFGIAVAVAASTSFITPIGYQTNLIVRGAGSYRFTDYVRVGSPLVLICFIVATFLIPLCWPF